LIAGLSFSALIIIEPLICICIVNVTLLFNNGKLPPMNDALKS
jgi:hypothetical protein